MSGGTFSAAEVRWQDQARCSGVAFDFAPDSETQQDLALVRGTWCNACPVRPECLAYALLYHLSGYWGGTDTAERRRLSYRRDRLKCPVCSSKALIGAADGHDICLHCGTSWRRVSALGQAAG